MSGIDLSEPLLARLAGWDAIKQARLLVAGDRVVDSTWEPPRLQGTVREGSSVYRAGLVIRSASDADNLCPCRISRQRGLICAHSVAVGLHVLKPAPAPALAAPPPVSEINEPWFRRAPDGEALELHYILPPNLPEAISRGKVMLVIEASRVQGRGPLSALPLPASYCASEQDEIVLNVLEQWTPGKIPAMMMLDNERFSELLTLWKNHPRVTMGKNAALQILNDPMRLPVRATLEKNGDILLTLLAADLKGLLIAKTPWLLQKNQFHPLELPPGLSQLTAGPVRIPQAEVPSFLHTSWPVLHATVELESNFTLDDFILETARPEFRLHLAGGLAMLEARLECFYNGQKVETLKSLWLPHESSPTRFAARDLTAEQNAVARLTRAGFTGPAADGKFHLKGQDAVLQFFARHYPALQKQWQVTLEERLQRSEQTLQRVRPQFEISSSGEQWFDLQVSYQAGEEQLSPADVQRLLRSGQSHTRLRNGKTALLDTGAVEELEQVLLDSAPRQQEGRYRINSAQAGFLDATLRGQSDGVIRASADWTRRAARQRGEIKLELPPLGALEDVLRPFQKEGVAWLGFLRAEGFGGILADEMGLGKTVQTLAHLAAVKQTASGTLLPSLVVCPTSLVFNWLAEAQKFTPGLRVLPLQGPQRHEKFALIGQHDLILTTYALLRRDAEQYRDCEFDTIVLDEAQHIKNRQTQNAQAVKAVRARHRLVLTGTPMENSVLDLWSIFDFLMPGYLGSAEEFRERYEIPITRTQDASAQTRLARRLRPFLLRRLKKDVAAQLPEKIEQVSYCEMAEEQRALYQEVLLAGRRAMLDSTGPTGAAQSRLLVLTTLLRLRQICCDPRLLPLERTSTAPPSAKTELFLELLEEALDGGHRVLVFSQFTGMLALLRQALEERAVTYCYLDGSTLDRAGEVARFQESERIPVFLISLKAGGAGLNLTGADTVLHFDPWWNPAVEAQATDRAHRIGQKKIVTSYKLITRGTVEEKILHLQTRKRALTDALLRDEEQFTQSLTWEEMKDLLAP